MATELIKDTDFVLYMADGENFTYYRFEHEKPIKTQKGDAILGVCKEVMDVLAYWEFDKQTNKVKAYIVEELIREKKEDGTYIKFEQPYSFSDEEDEDE